MCLLLCFIVSQLGDTVCNSYTVEPPKRGHFGTAAFVLSSEVVLFSEVVLIFALYTPYYDLNVFKLLYVTSYHSVCMNQGEVCGDVDKNNNS